MSAPLRWSQLKHIGKSPAHYRHALSHGVSVSPAMRLGTLIHEIALEQPVSSVVWEGDRRGKAWTDFREANDGREIVTASELHQAEMVAASIAADPLAMQALRGVREQQLTWRIGDRECQGRPDVVGDGFVTELKTCADASPGKFPWHARRMGYLGQLAFYGEGLAARGVPMPERYYIVAAEVKPPYVVQVYELDMTAIMFGSKQWRSYLERLQSCEENNSWPGYSQTTIPISVEEEIELDFGTAEDEEAA